MNEETSLSLMGEASLQVVEERLNEFRAFVKRVLKEGIDYGVIPGTQKPTLLKPGAERILQLYGLTATVIYDAAVEDLTASPPLIHYRVRMVLTHRRSAQVVGEGVGTCNSLEKKYRYRTEWWKDRKNPPPIGEGWEQARGKYGTGYRRQVPNPDVADLANTILKIAKKRALVDAALMVGAASEYFTQDMDDAPPVSAGGFNAPSSSAMIQETTHTAEEPSPSEDLEPVLEASLVYERLKQALLVGFRSGFHRGAWLRKHRAELESLPEEAKVKLRELYAKAKVGDGSKGEGAGTGGAVEGAAQDADPDPNAPAEGHLGEAAGGTAGGQSEGDAGGGRGAAAPDRSHQGAASGPSAEGARGFHLA